MGNGANTKVWLDNWIMDPLPRAPKYRQDAVVDLTLKTCDLMTEDFSSWDVRKVQEVIAEEDV